MRPFSLLFLLVACTPTASVNIGGDDDDDDDDITEDTDTDTEDTDTDTDTEDTDTEDTDTEPTVAEFDCALIPASPVSAQQMSGMRGYHDVEFHEDGTIFGSADWDNSPLVKSDYAGNVSVYTAQTDTIQQIVLMPDGNYAIANDSQGIQRLDAATGGLSTIAGGIYAYGLIWGPDDMLWAADQDRVWRVDSNTGATEEIVPRNALARGAPRVIAFNLDYTRLYIGTFGGSQGRIYAVDLDANYDPISLAYEFASGVGDGDYHDTMGVDICGNLYVADFWTASMHRIDRNGTRNKIVQWQFSWNGPYGHGMEWGTGEDGWGDHMIYMSQPYNNNNVLEIDIATPRRDWDGVAINLP